jgi:hypothetical protein
LFIPNKSRGDSINQCYYSEKERKATIYINSSFCIPFGLFEKKSRHYLLEMNYSSQTAQKTLRAPMIAQELYGLWLKIKIHPNMIKNNFCSHSRAEPSVY